jgi:hypothetical protein
VGAPLALAGVAVGHALANAVFGSPEGRDELFGSAASGANLLPLVSATAVAVILIGLAVRMWRSHWEAQAPASSFAFLPPLAFVLLEPLESLLHRGVVPFAEVAKPTFLAGLAFQLPFALAAYLVARLLLRAADQVRLFLVGEWSPTPLVISGPVISRTRDERARVTACGSRERGRAPPVGGLAVSG